MYPMLFTKHTRMVKDAFINGMAPIYSEILKVWVGKRGYHSIVKQ